MSAAEQCDEIATAAHSTTSSASGLEISLDCVTYAARSAFFSARR
jgi:hypothetical protein